MSTFQAAEHLEDALVTKPFKFIVGPDRIQFYIHEGFLYRLSAPIDALVYGQTKELLQGCVTWEDVDSDVFLRFAQYLYTGVYMNFAPTERDENAGYEEATQMTGNAAEKLLYSTVPEKLSSLGFGNEAVGQVNSTWGFGFSSSGFGHTVRNGKDDASRLPYSLASYLESYKTAVVCTRHFSPCNCGLGDHGHPSKKKRDIISAFMAKDSGTIWKGLPQTQLVSQNESIEHVFVGHARVWVFADRYAITPLKDLAYSNLVHELVQWRISASTFILEFGGLVRYVYDIRTIGGRQLRQLVTQFATCVVEDVSGLEGWSAMLHEVPGFAADLVHQMTSRFG